MRNKIEMKPSKSDNVALHEIFVNDNFYTAIVGINFDDKRGLYTKYRFTNDRLHAIIEPDDYPDGLLNSLRAEILELDTCKVSDLLYRD